MDKPKLTLADYVEAQERRRAPWARAKFGSVAEARRLRVRWPWLLVLVAVVLLGAAVVWRMLLR